MGLWGLGKMRLGTTTTNWCRFSFSYIYMSRISVVQRYSGIELLILKLRADTETCNLPYILIRKKCFFCIESVWNYKNIREHAATQIAWDQKTGKCIASFGSTQIKRHSTPIHLLIKFLLKSWSPALDTGSGKHLKTVSVQSMTSPINCSFLIFFNILPFFFHKSEPKGRQSRYHLQPVVN